MRRYQWISLCLLVVFTESFYLNHLLSPGPLIGVAIALVGSSAAFFALTSSLGLALAIAEILGVGFWLVFQAWLNNVRSVIQLRDVLLHLSLAVTIILMWLAARWVRQLVAENRDLLKENLFLKKIDAQTGVLTRVEFMYRFEVMWTAMKRREEQGCLVSVKLPADLVHTRDAVLRKTAQAALQSIRSNYDLVTAASEQEVWIALQNSTLQGAAIVHTRLFDAVSRALSLSIADRLSITHAAFDLSVSDAKTWLHSATGADALTSPPRQSLTRVRDQQEVQEPV